MSAPARPFGRVAKVVGTTAFKLSAIYIAVFSVFAVAFVLYISYTVNGLLTQQVHDTIAAEIQGLAEQGRAGGLAAIEKRGCELARLPIWAFHGTDDENVFLRGDTYPIEALKRCTDPTPTDARLTVFQLAGHDVWTRVYNGTAGYDIFDWMLSHTK